MTLKECLNEIKRVYLQNDERLLNRVAKRLLKDLRRSFCAETFPRSGWLLNLSEEAPVLVHKTTSLKVDLSVLHLRLQSSRPLSRYQISAREKRIRAFRSEFSRLT